MLLRLMRYARVMLMLLIRRCYSADDMRAIAAAKLLLPPLRYCRYAMPALMVCRSAATMMLHDAAAHDIIAAMRAAVIFPCYVVLLMRRHTPPRLLYAAATAIFSLHAAAMTMPLLFFATLLYAAGCRRRATSPRVRQTRHAGYVADAL